MSEIEQEQEIQARVEFKMKELLTGLKNRVQIKYGQAFDMTQRSNERWLAFQEIAEMAEKEIKMCTPSNNMAYDKKRKAKDIAVDKIVKSLKIPICESSFHSKLNTIVQAIEQAQNF